MKGVSQIGQTPSIIGICSYCVLDRSVFERCQTLLHPELTPWWLFADGAHHKKPHSPTHPKRTVGKIYVFCHNLSGTDTIFPEHVHEILGTVGGFGPVRCEFSSSLPQCRKRNTSFKEFQGNSLMPCNAISGLILGLCPANETSLQSNAVSHWLGANLESALLYGIIVVNFGSGYGLVHVQGQTKPLLEAMLTYF